jgi:hypothetical protein
MPPIIISPTPSTDDDPNLNVHNGSIIGVLPKDTLVVDTQLDALSLDREEATTDNRDDSGGEDYNNMDNTQHTHEKEVLNNNQEVDRSYGRRQSNLYSDEDKLPSIQTTSFLETNNELPSPQCDLAPPNHLSLMKSFSPTQSIISGLEDVDMSPYHDTQQQPFDDFAINILHQYNADEELARQLQEEENKKTHPISQKPKTRVLPSIADSLLGPPNPMEVRSQYRRVVSGSSSSSDYCLSSFSKWITSSATQFFGEDIGMQSGNSQVRRSLPSQDVQYRNAI